MIEKCGSCKKRLRKVEDYLIGIACTSCHKLFHKNCSLINPDGLTCICNECSLSHLPFFDLNNVNFGLTLKGKDTPDFDNLKLQPSFSIKTLLDKIPGKISIQTDEFLSESISSKYYRPDEFLSLKLKKNTFTVFHLNIASLQAHIDELKALLALLDHPFDIIGITETKIRENHETLIPIDLDNYFFHSVHTKTHFGGSGIYVRKHLEYDIRKDLIKSEENTGEAIFAQITHDSHKKIVAGVIYRHHTPIKSFVDNFVLDILAKVSKEKQKIWILLGDFNIDLLKIDSHEDSNYFYNILTSHGFRPLILQPTRVTLSSATLIDNIFINDMSASSIGGNLTSSISDHFPQFSSLDISSNPKPKVNSNFGRSYKNFNNDEFSKDLQAIHWDVLFENKTFDEKMKIFLDHVTKILDYMAPVKKLTRREVRARQSPWITKGIITSMKNRDLLYKKISVGKNLPNKEKLFSDFKRKRNLVTTLIRKSKINYYAKFFEDYKNCAKKTWEGIRDIIKVSNKSRFLPSKIMKNNLEICDNTDIANAYNEFFVNIGDSVEKKIPDSKNDFSLYLKKKVNNSISLTEITLADVQDMIGSLNTSKSCGPNSIPTNLLKDHCDILSNLLNCS